jgi:hypothetical protein
MNSIMIDQMPLRSFLKAVALAILLLSTPAWAASPSATPKPNIVIMFIDDMGYGDIGPIGNKVNQTPHLDRMAEEGRVLTQFYVANTSQDIYYGKNGLIYFPRMIKPGNDQSIRIEATGGKVTLNKCRVHELKSIW